MDFARRGAAFLITAALVTPNFIQPVFADTSPLDSVCAGAATILESDGINAGAGRAEYIAIARMISGVDQSAKEKLDDNYTAVISINSVSENNISIVDDVKVKTEDPLYELFGESIVMSNVNNSVNMRSEPDEEADLVGKLYHNCAGALLDQRDGWSHIRSGKVTGWVSNEYLHFGEEAISLAHQVGGLTATVETETLRIREDADENSAVYGLLAIGERIEVIDNHTDGWIKVSYSDDTEGYISSEFVSLAYDIDQAESIDEIEEREAKEREQKAREEEEARKAKEKRAKVEASRTTQTVNTNTGGVAAQADDVTLLAALIQAECGQESYQGKLAVGAVVVNRAKGRYGSIPKAIYAPGQFGPAASGKVAMIAAAGPTAECRQAAAEAIAGTSNVGAATHFRNIRSGYAGIVIGNHVFW